jgi:hypothetical protein
MRLGFMDGQEPREKIVDANIQWSEMISDIQRNLENSLNKLFNKIIEETINPKHHIPSYSFLKIHLNRPIILNLLQLQNVIATAGGIISTLTQLPNISNQIDFLKMLKELVPSINWDEFLISENKKESELENVPDEKQQQQQSEQGGASSGGFGGF